MTPLGQLTLVPATIEHAQLLFDWHNDPGTRRGSTQSEPTPWTDHVAWLEQVIEDPERHLFIVMAGDTPIGQVRIDRHDDRDAVISQAIEPGLRDRGLGVPTLLATVAEAGDLGYERAVGVVRTDNLASLRMVERAGWTIGEVILDDGVPVHRVHRSTTVDDDPRGKPIG